MVVGGNVVDFVRGNVGSVNEVRMVVLSVVVFVTTLVDVVVVVELDGTEVVGRGIELVGGVRIGRGRMAGIMTEAAAEGTIAIAGTKSVGIWASAGRANAKVRRGYIFAVRLVYVSLD